MVPTSALRGSQVAPCWHRALRCPATALSSIAAKPRSEAIKVWKSHFGQGQGRVSQVGHAERAQACSITKAHCLVAGSGSTTHAHACNSLGWQMRAAQSAYIEALRLRPDRPHLLLVPPA